MNSLTQPTRVLLDPLDATSAAVEARRWLWPMALLVLCTCASSTAFYLRWDAAPEVITQLQADGKLDRMTETELAEEIQTASRKVLVVGVAKGLFAMPLLTLLLAAALWGCAWLMDRSAPFGRFMSAAALALLPLALYSLIFTCCVLAQHSMTEARVQDLVPSSLAVLPLGLPDKLKPLMRGVDFFKLWSVGLLGLGFAAATGMRKGRAVLLFAVLYALFAGVLYVGLPHLMSQMSQGPGGPGGGGA